MPQSLKTDTLIGSVLHEWTIAEYERHERGAAWFWVMGIAGLALVIYAMLTGNFLFALIIILFAIVLFLQSHQEPIQLPFQITELGIVVGNRFYQYNELNGFYIIYNPPHVKTLYLENKSVFHPLLRIPLLDQNPVEVKHTLTEFLVEDIDKELEPLADRAARNWKLH